MQDPNNPPEFPKVPEMPAFPPAPQSPQPSLPDGSMQAPQYTPPPGMQQQSNQNALIALILSILGIIGLLPIIGSIIGLILANKAKAEIDASGGTQSGGDMAKIARILSIVGLALFGIGALCFCAIFALSLAGVATGM